MDMHQTSAGSKQPGLLNRLLRTIIGKQRRHERKLRGSAVYLFDATSFLGRGTLVDESNGGALISGCSTHILPLAKFAFNPVTGDVNTLVLAWFAGSKAGFRYGSTKQIRGYLTDPRLQHIRDFWSSGLRGSGHAAGRGGFAG